ncbi:hypothetical protein PC128_g18441 [Phytophthora cactorum]|nr:hypothetical protein PC128_g18441 [Phytophthora cactorum]
MALLAGTVVHKDTSPLRVRFRSRRDPVGDLEE